VCNADQRKLLKDEALVMQTKVVETFVDLDEEEDMVVTSDIYYYICGRRAHVI